MVDPAYGSGARCYYEGGMWESEEPQIHPELESLAQTPEGEGLERIQGSGDSRDFTPPPPAYMDAWSKLNMIRMVKDAAANGDRAWPYNRNVA